MKNNNNLNQLTPHFAQYSAIIFFCTLVPISFASTPNKANYQTSTTHNCKNYQCEKSLYNPQQLDIKRDNVIASQINSHIEKHINAIQTTDSSFPGFNSTVLKKIPKNMTDKALHCHKAKPQKISWKNPQQSSTTLQYRHQCWQYSANKNNSNKHQHKAVKRVKDVTYSITITRTAASCSSSLETAHATKFECVAKKFRQYSLVPLDEVVVAKNVIAIRFDSEEIEFALLGVSDDFNIDDSTDATSATEPPLAPGVVDNSPIDAPLSDEDLPEHDGNDDEEDDEHSHHDDDDEEHEHHEHED